MRSFLIPGLLISALIVPAMAQSAPTDDSVKWREVPGTNITYGPPETESMFSLYCTKDRRLEATWPDSLGARENRLSRLSVDGLGGSQTISVTIEEVDGDWFKTKIAPGSVILTNLLAGQDLRFRGAGKSYVVPGAGARDMAQALIVKCLRNKASAEPIGAKADQARQEPEVAALITQSDKLNGLCRGGSGDNPATMKACEDRDRLGLRIDRLGWCYGRKDQYGAQYRWHRCTSASIRL